MADMTAGSGALPAENQLSKIVVFGCDCAALGLFVQAVNERFEIVEPRAGLD